MKHDELKQQVEYDMSEIVDTAAELAATAVGLPVGPKGSVAVPGDKAEMFYGALAAYVTLEILKRQDELVNG